MVNLSLLISVLVALVVLFWKWPLHKVTAVGVFVAFLLQAQSTGDDYETYQIGFETVVLTGDFPYVHASELDSEPAFLWYMLLCRTLVDDFRVFLALTFLLWIALLYPGLRWLGLTDTDLQNAMICAFPTVIPVVIYWSPRSALSLPMLVFAIHFLNKRAPIRSLAMAILAMQFHSQYIPVACVILGTSILRTYCGFSVIRTATVLSTLLIATLRFNMSGIYSLPVIGDSDLFQFPVHKLHYFEGTRDLATVRPSGIIMIVLALSYLFSFRRRLFQSQAQEKGGSSPDAPLRNALDIAAVFSLVTNLLFIHDSHIAGRVSRFADFFFICVGLPQIFRSLWREGKERLATSAYSLCSMGFYWQIYVFSSGY